MAQETIADITQERVDCINRAIKHDQLTEDVRSATALLARLASEEAEASKRGKALEKVIAVARELPADCYWEGHLMGGRAQDSLVTIAGSALRLINQLAERRATAQAAAEKKLANAQAALTE